MHTTIRNRSLAWTRLTARRNRWALCCAAVAVLVGCGGGGSDAGKHGGDGPVAPPAPVVASVAIRPPTGPWFIVGTSVALVVDVRDAAGATVGGAVGGAVTWTSSAPSVVAVSTNGTALAVGAGTATVTATAGGRSGSLQLDVVPVLAITDVAAVVDPSAGITIRGTGLSRATVSMGGQPATILSANDTVVQARVAPAVVSPCRAAGPIDIAVRDGMTEVVVQRAAAEVPFHMPGIAPGAHLLLTAAVARQCTVELPDAGTYVAMPFAFDRPDTLYDRIIDSVGVRLTVSPPGTAASDVPHVRMDAPSSTLGAALRAGPLHVLPTRATDVAVPMPVRGRNVAALPCVLPSALGDSVSMLITRDATGRAQAFGGGRRESWIVVGEGTGAVFYADTGFARMLRTSAIARDHLHEYVSAWDSVVVPTVQRFTRGVTTGDGTGRVAVLLVRGLAGAGGLAFPQSVPIIGCQGQSGEPGPVAGFLLDVTIGPGWEDLSMVARLVVLSAHELTHVADLPARPSIWWTGWTSEGLATLMESLLGMRALPDPLHANLGQPPYFELSHFPSSHDLCGVPTRAGIWRRPVPEYGEAEVLNIYAYNFGCEFIAYLAGRAASIRGWPVETTLHAWSNSVGGVTFHRAAVELYGEPASEAEFLAAYFLSWYADDYVPGVDASLTQPMWNLRRYVPGSTAPDAVLSSDGGTLAFTLWTPEARLIEFPSRVRTRLRVETTSGGALPTTRADVAILRIR